MLSEAWTPLKIKFNWDASFWTKQMSTLGKLSYWTMPLDGSFLYITFIYAVLHTRIMSNLIYTFQEENSSVFKPSKIGFKVLDELRV